MTRFKYYTTLARFNWMIMRLTISVAVLRMLGAEKQLAEIRAIMVRIVMQSHLDGLAQNPPVPSPFAAALAPAPRSRRR